VSAASDPGLRVDLEFPLPRRLPTGRGTALLCFGTCFHSHQAVEALEIVADGVRHRPDSSRMPRLDLFRRLHPSLSTTADGSAETDPSSIEDPEVRCYRSGFWSTIPVEPRRRPGGIALRLDARLSDGTTASAELGRIEVVEPTAPPSYDGLRDRAQTGLIAICMATFDPDDELFRTQIDSLRAQTDTNWICLISDDCSRPDRFETIEATVRGDRRFVISRSPRRLGFYRNFERALEMVPGEADFVALCDQDDRWYPDKLEVLRRAIGEARLAYCDMRLVDAGGRVIASTLWDGRRNNHTNFASMLIANSIPGAASLMRREVAELALPFPEAPGDLFHDHWLGVVAMATGEVAYVDRPLYDYIQHGGAIQGKMAVEAKAPAPHRSRRHRFRRRLLGFFTGWRPAYFFGYLPLQLQAQVLLARCSSLLTARKRRTLRRIARSSDSPFDLAWLAIRPARALFGRNETLAAEQALVKGILWRHIVRLRTRGRAVPHGSRHDASLPPAGSFDQRRLRRWRARR